MIANLVRQYVAGPLARLARLIPFEPVVVAGLFAEALFLLQSDLENGIDLETALTSVIIAIGTRLLRQSVWPAAKIDATTATPVETLEAPITGVPD